jgi:hypothetical protein
LRQRTVVLIGVGVPLLAFGSWIGYHHWWWRGAESAVLSAIAMTRAAQTSPDVQVTLDAVAATDLGTNYELTGADNNLAGTSLLDLLGPGIYVAHARSSNGLELHVEARRFEGRWMVSLSPAEGT